MYETGYIPTNVPMELSGKVMCHGGNFFFFFFFLFVAAMGETTARITKL